MMRVRAALSVLSILSVLSSAMHSASGGKVFDPSGMPVAGAWVKVCGDHCETAVTDSQGKFNINVPRLGPESYG